MVEVHEAVAFVELASGVDGQMQRVERAFVRLIDFTDKFLSCVLVGNVAHHDVGTLVFTRRNAFDRLVVY